MGMATGVPHTPYNHTSPMPNLSAGLRSRALGGGMGLAASIKVLSGAAAGKSVTLTKVVTTVGKPGVQVASITKRPTGYVLAHVEGAMRPSINGVSLVTDTGAAVQRRPDRAGRHANAVRARVSCPGPTRAAP